MSKPTRAEAAQYAAGAAYGDALAAWEQARDRYVAAASYYDLERSYGDHAFAVYMVATNDRQEALDVLRFWQTREASRG